MPMLHTEFHSFTIITETWVPDNFYQAYFSTSIWLEISTLIESPDFSIFYWRSYDIFDLDATIITNFDQDLTVDGENSF
jgi:hypothetical protein